MNIEGINIPSTIAPFTTDDTYATHDEQYGKGGYRAVSTVSEMNAIPSQRRKEGMLVKVTSTNEYYTLKNGTFVKENFGNSGSGSETIDIEYVDIDYSIFSDLIANNATSSDIVAAIGQSNLDRMFSEDECPINFYNILSEGVSIFTKCILKGSLSETSLISIPIEVFNIAYNIMLQNNIYSIERIPYITFDSSLDGVSMNAPQTKIVYNELNTKAGIYKTNFKFGEVEYNWQYGSKSVTSAQLNELQKIRSAIIAGKLVLTNDETGNTFYKGIVNYITADDSSCISLVIADDRGNPKCFTYDGTDPNAKWDIHGVEVESNSSNNSNIKYLTTPDLFNLNRNEVVTLNANDVAVISSLYGKKYRNTQVYYIGNSSGDYGIYPVNISSNGFEESDKIDYASEYIYLSITNDIGIPIKETLSINSITEIVTTAKALINDKLFSNGFNKSLNGYEKFNDGLMIQWGKGTYNGSQVTITFPLTFSNIYNVSVTLETTNKIEVETLKVLGKNTNSFGVIGLKINNNVVSQIVSSSFDWIAIGTWK